MRSSILLLLLTASLLRAESGNPSWLKEFSLGVTQGYDSNVYFIDHTAPGGVPADHSSAFTQFNPRVAVTFVPFLNLPAGDQSITALDFSYDATVTEFWSASRESNTRHKFGTGLAGKFDNGFSYGVTNEFIFVDGKNIGDRFVTPGVVSAYSYAFTRERKKQFQDRLHIFTWQDVGDFFARPTASLLYYDMMTRLDVPPDYAFYPDRYDVNGGLDLGYRLNKDVAVYVGYRYGHQFHGVNVYRPGQRSFTNDYQRLLLGVEGKPWSWLTVNLAAGPDFRNYDRAGLREPIPGGFDANKITYYLYGGCTVNLTARDSLVVALNHFQWLSSTGNSSYFDRITNITYKRQITDRLAGSVGFRLLESDYDNPAIRDDWVYGCHAGLSYKIDENWSVALDYVYMRGENQQDNTTGREFDNHTVGVGVKWKL